jgi:Rhodopirellula transposase DDE domain
VGVRIHRAAMKTPLGKRTCKTSSVTPSVTVTLSHYPTACSKWNPVEYRLFSHISMNWAGQPLRNLDVMLAFIRGTTTKAGLRVEGFLDQRIYRKGRKVIARQLKELALSTHDICPRWNYTLAPRPTK